MRLGKEFECRVASSYEEVMESYRIRYKVFVEEQELFKENDIDEFDDSSVVIVALVEDRVIGTVRVYEKEPGVWYGSRLAVLKEYRGSPVARHLIFEAINFVKKEGAKKFLAWVQLKNVRFFKRLGWVSVTGIEDYCGFPHVLMEYPI